MKFFSNLLFLAFVLTSEAAVSIPGQVKIDFRPASNASVIEKRFKRLTQKSIEELMTFGIYQIGDIDLTEFKEKIESVQVKAVKTVELEAGIGKRESAAWRGNTIYISEFMNYLNDEELTGMGLHELSGSLGVDDFSFEFSSLLLQTHRDLLKGTAEQTATFLKEHYQDTKFKSLRLAQRGGVSGVGGGGDVLLLRWKLILMKKNREIQIAIGPGQISSTIEKRVHSLQVELSSRVPEDEVRYTEDTLVLNRLALEGKSDAVLDTHAVTVLSTLLKIWFPQGK